MSTDRSETIYMDGCATPFRSFDRLVQALAGGSLNWALSESEAAWLHAHGPFPSGRWHAVTVASEPNDGPTLVHIGPSGLIAG